MSSSHGELLLNATINGQGVMMASTCLVNDAFNHVKLVLVLEDFKLEAGGLYALYPYSKFVPKKRSGFFSFFSETFKPVVLKFKVEER